MHLYLRHVCANDAPLLQYWDKKPHVSAATNTTAFYDDWAGAIEDAPAWRELFIAIIDNRPIGFLQIIDPGCEPTGYWSATDQLMQHSRQGTPETQKLRALDIWIGEESDLNCGYGTTMMHLAHRHCFARPDVSAIVIDPLAGNVKAIRFYKRLGYQYAESRVLADDHCEVYRLDKETFTAATGVYTAPTGEPQ